MCIDVEKADGLGIDLFKYESIIAGYIYRTLMTAFAMELVVVKDWVKRALCKYAKSVGKCQTDFLR